MKRYVYAIYEADTRAKLCLGVWDSARDLSAAWQISLPAVYRNVRQTLAGRKFSRTGISIRRVRTR